MNAYCVQMYSKTKDSLAAENAPGKTNPTTEENDARAES